MRLFIVLLIAVLLGLLVAGWTWDDRKGPHAAGSHLVRT